MTFQTPSDYLRAYEKDQTLAILPLQTVADFRGVGRAAIDGMLRNGKLEEIRIGKTRYVRLSSLVDLQREYDQQVAQIRAYLEQCAREQKIVTYEPVMAILGLSTGVPAHRSVIGGILGTISEQSWKDHQIILSVIVHRKTTGKTRPGPGFFELAESLDDIEGWNTEDELIQRETQKVWDFYATSAKAGAA